MSLLDGRVALVTGGSKGIGAAIVRSLADAGAAVVSTSRSGGSAEGNVRHIRADVRDADAAQRAVDEAVAAFGGLDILVNNAGVGSFANVADMTLEGWRNVIETNLSGVFYCCRAAIPHLRQRGGWIINISSLAAKNAFAGGAAYCASKAGLNQFSEALMHEVRHDDIRVSCVMPGSVATDFGRADSVASGTERPGDGRVVELARRGAGGPAAKKEGWALTAEDVAQVVMDLLAMAPRSLPSRVELRPSKPPKK